MVLFRDTNLEVREGARIPPHAPSSFISIHPFAFTLPFFFFFFFVNIGIYLLFNSCPNYITVFPLHIIISFFFFQYIMYACAYIWDYFSCYFRGYSASFVLGFWILEKVTKGCCCSLWIAYFKGIFAPFLFPSFKVAFLATIYLHLAVIDLLISREILEYTRVCVNFEGGKKREDFLLRKKGVFLGK